MAPGRLAVLPALTVGPAVGEAVVLRSLHFRSALPLAAQVTAPAPFGVFHDLRWLIVYHDSWWGLISELAAAIALRGLLDAAIVGAAWPPGLPRPGFIRRLRTSASFTAIALLVLSPWAAVAFAASETALSCGWELRGMFAVIRLTSSIHSSPDEPFIRSLLDHAPRYRDGMLCLVPGARTIAFLPTAAAAVVPPGQLSEVPVIELPGVHASLLGRPDVQQRIQRFLTGHQAGTAPRPYFPIIQRAASAWQAPALPLALNPAWHAIHLPDPAFGGNGCAAFAPPG
ncbi:MAG: hypothetical protein WAK86_04070 [Pseudonocardiaceae bacterium]